MTQGAKARVLVVLHLIGGNDALNTLVPYGDPLYYDSRPVVHIPEEEVLPINDRLGLHPSMAALKPFWDQGKMALVMGIGYANPNYSHFRSTDIWETAEPSKTAYGGWLARAVREMDPRACNVLTAVNFGRGLPRALSLSGVPVASVSTLEAYGLFSNLVSASERRSRLGVFERMYSADETNDCRPSAESALFPNQAAGALRHLAQTGLAALKGADILNSTCVGYNAMVEYPRNPIGEKLKGIAQVKSADLGTRIFYAAHGSFDLHAIQIPNHAERWREISESVAAFFDDLRLHSEADDVVLFIWSEFGRRVRDNGSGTDHGAGGLAFVIGDPVRGGLYGEYPSLRRSDLVDGNLACSVDFRMAYSSLLERWLEVEARPIVGATFEQIAVF